MTHTILPKIIQSTEKEAQINEEIWKRLLTQGLNAKKLRFIVERIPFLRENAGKKLLENNPDMTELMSVIVHTPSLREKAWKKLTEEGPTKVILCTS